MENISSQNLLSESPVTANSPAFWPSLKTFKDNISSNIYNIPNNSPMLICGDWGSGKTSLLRAIQQDIENTGNPTVWFDAWRYENEDNLLPALIRTIWAQKKIDENIIKPKEHEHFETALKTSIALGIRAIPAILGTIFGSGVEKMLEGVFNRLTVDSLRKEIKAIELSPEKCQTDELSESFENMVTDIINENQELTIFIDDLDRCSPESALNLIDQIRRLIHGVEDTSSDKQNEQKFRFIIALDKITLADAVKHKYKSLEHYDANRYLEKLFPISFNMPAVSDEEIPDFIDYHINELAKNKENQSFFGASLKQLKDGAKQVFSKHYFNNPRLAKRCLNQFFLLAHFNSDNKNSQATNNYGDKSYNLLGWIAAGQKWPEVRELIVTKSQKFWRDFVSYQENSDITSNDNEKIAALSNLKSFSEFVQDFNISTNNAIFKKRELSLRHLGL